MDEHGEILQRLARIESKLDIVQDHEKRIRSLEKYYFMVAGGFWLAGVGIGIAIKFL